MPVKKESDRVSIISKQKIAYRSINAAKFLLRQKYAINTDDLIPAICIREDHCLLTLVSSGKTYKFRTKFYQGSALELLYCG